MKKCLCYQSLPKSLKKTCRWGSFLDRAFLLVFLGLGLFSPSVRADEYRAFWVDAWGAGFLNQSQVDALLGVVGDPNSRGTLRDANCNSVIVQVRRRFDVCYPSGVGEPYMSGLSPANFNALAAMIKAAHDTTGGKKRIEVHCWSVAFKTSKGTVYAQHSNTNNADNYWPTRIDSTTGAENGDGAFDPGHPKVLEYLVNAHMDLVNFQTVAGTNGLDGHIDGIHYDYIRFEDSKEGFNPTSVARYNARYGLTGEPASSSEQFKQWRRDQVSAFVRQMYARIQKTKPWVKQSGSFITWNPSPVDSTRAAFTNTRSYYDVYSDWDSWLQEGTVDMAVPMTYYRQATMPDDYVRWMNFEKDRHSNRHMIIGPGIYLNSLSDAILHLNLTRDPSPAGNYAQGFCGYSYKVPYISGTWAGFSPSLVTQVTTNWADIPPMPWKITPTTGHMMGQVTQGGSGVWADHATVSITGPVSRSQFVDGTGFYAFIDLPPGSYNVTASKAGYPNTSATVTVAVGAVTGNMYEQNFVLASNALPSIASQPQSRTVGVGSNVTFAVTASGTPLLKYEWLFANAAIAGATNSTYTRTNAQLADAGNYTVVITNDFGSVTSSPAGLTVVADPEPPGISTQPQGTNVVAGQTATFRVGAGGTMPLSYQWRWQGTNLAGATGSVFTRANAQSVQAGNYTVVITNAFGSVTSQVAMLTIVLPPSLIAQPQSTNVIIGQNAAFAATASGTAPLFYQWRFQGNPLAGLTTANLALAAVSTNQAGNYDLVVTNAYGAITSQVATLTVVPPPPPSRLELLWQLAPFSRPYLTTNELPYERGMAYNPASHHVLVASRSNHIYVLDAETGSHLHEMNMSGVTGGLNSLYYILLVSAAEDGAVYAANLKASSADFKIYRWANDNSNTVPSVIFAGDPVPGSGQRWGDSFAVRGSGTNTQILIGPRYGTNVVMFTTTNGLNFAPSQIRLLDTPSGHIALGLTFGAGDTFWGTTHTNALRQITFDLAAGTGVTTRFYDNAAIPNAICPIGVSPALNMLAGVHVASPNHLRVYDLTLTNGTPVLIGSTNFPVDNPNTHTGAGAVDFGSNTVYALDANNGLMALRIAPLPPLISLQPESLTVSNQQSVVLDVNVTGTAPFSYQWRRNDSDLVGATGSSWFKLHAELSDAGNYTVVITNIAGSTTSQVATLTVTLPLTFAGLSVEPGQQIALRGSGTPGGYVVEATSTPFTNWVALTNLLIAPDGNFEWRDAVTNAPQRFYRIKGL